MEKENRQAGKGAFGENILERTRVMSRDTGKVPSGDQAQLADGLAGHSASITV